MLRARPVTFERSASLELGLLQLGLPLGAREYLHERLPFRRALLTGLSREEHRALRQLSEGADDPGREPFGELVLGRDACLVAARRDQLERLCAALTERQHLALATALARLELIDREPASWALGSKHFAWGERTFIMGVLNVTPDSFSDGGHFSTVEAAVAHAKRLVADGADLLDVGGESTRPGSVSVSEAEELNRVLPVLAALHRELPETPVSLDTSKPEVARAGLEAGAVMINDITGFRDDEMLRVLATSGAFGCAMHMQGVPATMQVKPESDDIVRDVFEALEQSLARAEGAGVARGRLMIDPGFGFGKRLEHNLTLHREVATFRMLGVPLLVGTSRKSFLGTLSGVERASERVQPSVASAVALAEQGAHVVRVHDVRETKQALAIIDAMRPREARRT